MVTDNKIGKNIKYLRLADGETQMELAYALGLKAPTAITNYESEHRKPKRKILQKIAVHYRITEEELVNGDFSKLTFEKCPIGDKEKKYETAEMLLLIIYTEQAYTDPLFKKGFDSHMQMYETMKARKSINEHDFDVCINAYMESFELNGTLESVANCLWWFLLIGVGISNADLNDGAMALEKKQIDKRTFLKEHYLKNCDDELCSGRGCKTELQDFLSNGEEVIIFLLQELNASVQWSNLANYYLAIRYLFCIIDNDYSDEINRAIGEEMMLGLASIGNPYAKKIIQSGIDNMKEKQ